MTDAEWQKVYEMSKDKNLYSHLCNSLFPTIHGELGFENAFLKSVSRVFIGLELHIENQLHLT